MPRRKIVKRVALLVAIIIGALAVPASALSYDKNDGAFGPPGSQLLLGTEAVPSSAVGLTCDVIVDIGNNESVRPGSDITVTTGTDSHTFLDTEGKAGDPGPTTIRMVMGETVTVTLTFGPNLNVNGDAEFSGAGTVEVGACVTPPPDVPIVVSPDVLTRPRTAPVAPTVATAVTARPAFTG
jgi:hypothetical protein